VKLAYHHKDLRNAIVDAAIAILNEHSHAELTLRELARRLGVTHTAPYAHFSDKTQLLNAVADVGFARLADTLEASILGEPDAASAFAKMGLAYVQFARENANLYRLMFTDPDIAADPECELSPEGERALAAVAKLVALLGTPAEAVGDMAVSAWAFVHGVAMLEIDHRFSAKTRSSGDEIFTLGMQAFIRGLRSRG
jgi:AcrR family transcriptional regulator